jgi:hypothetical protein
LQQIKNHIKKINPYKTLSKLVENESYEPMLSWGIRMTFAVIIPLFYGLYFHKMAEVMWVIVAAESIGWVELKGSFAQRSSATPKRIAAFLIALPIAPLV